ncbi:MAG: tetratricopeptide repeat protein, partial [Wenzhouxiangella sp.]
DTSHWATFSADGDFSYEGAALKKNWEKLHLGDREPWPEDPALQQAWRDYHAGRFGEAVEAGTGCGASGHVVINKASGIYADYLEENDGKKQAIYQAGIERASAAIEQDPDNPNAHYFHAYHLGRYSQSISITKALSEGLGGRIRESLDRTLELQPEHAEAHTALGLYHAEVISKLGKLVGSMTYGASADKAMEHFQEAIRLSNAPIAWIEYGNGLYLLHGERRIDESNEAYARAAAMKPIEAMQALDIEYAKSSLPE